MKKTINIYTPQEKMPEPDTKLLVVGPKLEAIAYYYQDNKWYVYDTDVPFDTDDIDWWINLEKLTTDISFKFIRLQTPSN